MVLIEYLRISEKGILSLMMYSCVVFLPAYTMKIINQAHVVFLQKEEIN